MHLQLIRKFVWVKRRIQEVQMHRTHADTIAWLERQLSELEIWRRDLIGEGAGEPCQLEQIELHRTWLEGQISRLTDSNLTPVT